MPNFAYFAVTPAATPQPQLIQKLWVDVTGSLVVQAREDSSSVTFAHVPVGWFELPHPVMFVLAASSAGGLIASAATASPAMTPYRP